MWSMAFKLTYVFCRLYVLKKESQILLQEINQAILIICLTWFTDCNDEELIFLIPYLNSQKHRFLIFSCQLFILIRTALSLTMDINLKVHVIFSLFFSMVVLKPLLCCRSATYIFPCPLTLSLNLSLYSLFLIMPFIPAVFDTQLKMGGLFVCQEQLHSFYFQSFNSFSF